MKLRFSNGKNFAITFDANDVSETFNPGKNEFVMNL